MTGRFARYGEDVPRRSASSPESPLEPDFPAPRRTESPLESDFPRPRRTAESVPPPPRFTGPRRSAVSPESPDKTTVFRRITEPVARRSAGSPDTPAREPGQWRNVPRDDDNAEDEVPTKTPRHHVPPIPRFVKIMGIIAVVVVLVVAVWLGLALSGFGKPSADASPDWDLKLPSQIGNFANDGVKEAPALNGEGTILRSNYSDGESQFALLLQRPAPELESYLTKEGITGLTSVNDASCGTYEKQQMPVCTRVIDKTIILVMGFNNQDNETLANLIETSYKAIKGQH